MKKLLYFSPCKQPKCYTFKAIALTAGAKERMPQLTWANGPARLR